MEMEDVGELTREFVGENEDEVGLFPRPDRQPGQGEGEEEKSGEFQVRRGFLRSSGGEAGK